MKRENIAVSPNNKTRSILHSKLIWKTATTVYYTSFYQNLAYEKHVPPIILYTSINHKTKKQPFFIVLQTEATCRTIIKAE